MILRKPAMALVICACAVILTGCTSPTVEYQGVYFSQANPTSLSARVTSAVVWPNTPILRFEAITPANVEISSNFVNTDVIGRATINVNWPANVYVVNAVADSYVSGVSEPAALTIVNAFQKGIFAGGLLKVDSYVDGAIIRKTAFPRNITVGLQYPEMNAATNPVKAFVLIDNDYPNGPGVFRSTTFTAERLKNDQNQFAGVKFTGQGFAYGPGPTPLAYLFTAYLTPAGGGTWKLSLTINTMDGTLLYQFDSTLIEKGGVVIRPAP